MKGAQDTGIAEIGIDKFKEANETTDGSKGHI